MIDKVFTYCRQRGFPHYDLPMEKKLRELNNLKKFDLDSIVQNGIVRQTLHGMGLAWSYFPHHWEIRTRKMKTALDVFNNDELLKKAIASRIKWGTEKIVGENGEISDANYRKALRTYSGVQRVSNFRPSAASGIYRKYAKNGVVWDMSCGFGGRLIGALASGTVKKYIGTDPSTPTMQGLLRIKEDFCQDFEVELHQIGSENFVPNEPVDLCFTSPPYFDTERYTDEATQSYVAYDTNESWNENFLRKTIQNCHKALKDNGFMLINIANVVTHKTLEDDTVRIAGEEKFELVEILKMQLSSITKGGFKYEPIFVFKKI
jgi:hypothetical protein